MNLSNYRVDRMDKVEMLSEDITPSSCAEDFNTHKHTKQVFSMYTGETEKVTFEINANAIDVIFDRFGEKTKFAYLNEDTFKFSANVSVSPTFFAWCVGLGKNLRILAPEHVKDAYTEYLKGIVDFQDFRK